MTDTPTPTDREWNPLRDAFTGSMDLTNALRENGLRRALQKIASNAHPLSQCRFSSTAAILCQESGHMAIDIAQRTLDTLPTQESPLTPADRERICAAVWLNRFGSDSMSWAEAQDVPDARFDVNRLREDIRIVVKELFG